MRKFTLLYGAACVVLILISAAGAQIKGQGVEIGIAGGAAVGQNEIAFKNQNGEANGRLFIGIPLLEYLGLDIGGGMTRNAGTNYKTDLVPVDVRLRLGLTRTSVTPYVYAGVGALNWNVKSVPPNTISGYKQTGWTGFVPYGAGVEFRFNPTFALDLSGGENLSFSDYINPVAEGKDENKDSFMSLMAGLRVALGAGNPDWDHDGLSNKEEKALGTDPRKADTDGDGLDDFAEVHTYNTDPLKTDTDGDGLTDGEEVLTYHTNPLKADTDGDGLSDGDEVHKYHTNPLKADTDGDGLSDGAEVLKYHTDPLKADTDGDGLSDGAEVLKYHTDPLKADTDGDGLNDGDEVLKYHTDPLKADTDGGGVNDGVEVARGTNPLDPTDDVPKKAVIQLETGKPIILEGIVFSTGKADILPASEEVLTKALNTLQDNPKVTVKIVGYTDNVGKREANVKLSLKRAESVKAWLVAKGIETQRLTTEGKGPDNPVADNKTPEGRQKNRRIEFERTN